MKRICSFSLGNIWRWSKSTNRNVLIDYVKKLDISGVELLFNTKETLYSFVLSETNKQWLRNLDYVSIHAPFDFFEETENEVLNQIRIISKLYDDIYAKNVIVHPNDYFLRSDPLKGLEVNLSVENLPRKSGVPISDLRKILNKCPQMKFCLDVSHAYTWSKNETDELVKAFKDRISQIHFSGTYRKKDHQSLKNVSKDFLRSIQPIKKLEVPIVIEEDIEVKSLKYVKEEIEYIRNLFN